MLIPKKPSLRLAALTVLLALFTSNAFADRLFRTDSHNRHAEEHRPEKQLKQHYKHDKYRDDRRYKDDRRRHAVQHRFHQNDRRLINDYYRDQQYRGKCPRGLAKKNNRCQPPRYAKKWHKGQPLSKQVKYYKLPNRLHGRLQPVPRDYRYVRVDNDVLMIDTVTNVVVDVIENILR